MLSRSGDILLGKDGVLMRDCSCVCKIARRIGVEITGLTDWYCEYVTEGSDSTGIRYLQKSWVNQNWSVANGIHYATPMIGSTPIDFATWDALVDDAVDYSSPTKCASYDYIMNCYFKFLNSVEITSVGKYKRFADYCGMTPVDVEEEKYTDTFDFVPDELVSIPLDYMRMRHVYNASVYKCPHTPFGLDDPCVKQLGLAIDSMGVRYCGELNNPHSLTYNYPADAIVGTQEDWTHTDPCEPMDLTETRAHSELNFTATSVFEYAN